MKIAYHASTKPRAQQALEELKGKHAPVKDKDAEVIVVVGGDGTMLRALHHYAYHPAPLFGINLGTLGFLLNVHDRNASLEKRIENAEKFIIRPLEMTAIDRAGKKHKELAFNEVSVLRETHNSAKIRIHVNDKPRLEELVCDGILVSTAVGSTAYNSSAGGPILPLDSNLLPLTPISPFRPRRWGGALLRDNCKVKFEILKPVERPVSATADSKEVRDVKEVLVEQSTSISKTILFDPDNPLQERIFNEQFGVPPQ